MTTDKDEHERIRIVRRMAQATESLHDKNCSGVCRVAEWHAIVVIISSTRVRSRPRRSLITRRRKARIRGEILARVKNPQSVKINPEPFTGESTIAQYSPKCSCKYDGDSYVGLHEAFSANFYEDHENNGNECLLLNSWPIVFVDQVKTTMNVI